MLMLTIDGSGNCDVNNTLPLLPHHLPLYFFFLIAFHFTISDTSALVSVLTAILRMRSWWALPLHKGLLQLTGLNKRPPPPPLLLLMLLLVLLIVLIMVMAVAVLEGWGWRHCRHRRPLLHHLLPDQKRKHRHQHYHHQHHQHGA
jgi:hypothetical protein